MSNQILKKMADQDQIYVQSIRIRLKTPGGEIMESKFTGLAMCSPDQWQQVKEIGLGKLMEGIEGSPIMFSEPKLIDDLVTEGSDSHDIIDSLRSELRRDHHSKLSE